MKLVTNNRSARRRVLWIVVAVIMAGFTAIGLMHIDAASRLLGSIHTPAAPTTAASPEVRSMIAELEVRSEHARDPETWIHLAQAYAATGRTKEANTAYTKAYERAPDNPQVVAEYAWSLYRQDSESVGNSARPAYEQLRQIDPNHPQALLYLAMAAVQHGDYRTALSHWEDLLKTLPPDSPLADDIKRAMIKTRMLAPRSARHAADGGERTY